MVLTENQDSEHSVINRKSFPLDRKHITRNKLRMQQTKITNFLYTKENINYHNLHFINSNQNNQAKQ